jgi:hypothetical protein
VPGNDWVDFYVMVMSQDAIAEDEVWSGHPSQVHVRERGGEAWRTVWTAEHEQALYPQCLADAEAIRPR